MTGAASPLWVNTLRLSIFVPFLCTGWLFYLVYAVNTLRKQRHYFLRVRFPSLVLADLCQSLFTLHAVCLHEIYLAQGRRLPCLVTNMATVLTPTNYLAIFLVRGLQLIVIFDPAFRAKYCRALPTLKISILVLCVVVAVAFTLAMDLSPTPFCHTPSLCHTGDSCVWGASYYLVLILVGLFHFALVPVLRHMMKLDIQERIGFTLEFKRIIAMSVTLNAVIFASLALVDWGVLSPDWHVITDLTLCTAFACNFYIGHVVPARKFGYAPPFLPISGRRIRRRLRHCLRAVLKRLPCRTRRDRRVAADDGMDKTKAGTSVLQETGPAKLPPMDKIGQGLSAMGKSMHKVMLQLEAAAGTTTLTTMGSTSNQATLFNLDLLTLDELCDHRELREALLEHCKNHLDEEGILFLLDTRDLRALDLGGTGDGEEVSPPLPEVDRARLAWICETYLRVDGLYVLQLTPTVHNTVYRLLKWDGTKRIMTWDGKPSLPDDVTTPAILRMFKQVGRTVEHSLEEHLLPIFFSLGVYATHSPAILASSTLEQSAKRAEVNHERAGRLGRRKSDGAVRPAKAKRGGLRNFGQADKVKDVETGQGP